MARTVRGYIKIHRSIVDWEWWDDVPVRLLWITILMEANWKDKKWKGKKIKRGSFWTSIDSLSDKTGLSRQQVRTALAKLRSTREITCKSTREGTLITVVNYGLYQDEGEVSTHRATDRTADNQHTSNTRATLTNKYKKDKKERRGEESSSLPDGSIDLLAGID